jgi:hypothetical protein
VALPLLFLLLLLLLREAFIGLNCFTNFADGTKNVRDNDDEDEAVWDFFIFHSIIFQFFQFFIRLFVCLFVCCLECGCFCNGE